VLGASFDTPEENKAFIDAQGFQYDLLSDADKSVGTAYEVTLPADHKYAGYPQRVSFLIDPTGVIRAVYEVKELAEHATQVVADLATFS
jgi:thioredoxin-dependent peroxiredoxin